MSDRENPASGVDEVGRWLAAQRQEVAMPETVARRVQEALEHEASARSAGTRSAGTQDPGADLASHAEADVLPMAGRHTSGQSIESPSTPRGSRLLAAASVAALAVLGLAVVVPLLGQGGDSAAETSAIGEAALRDGSSTGDQAASGESRMQAAPEGESGASGPGDGESDLLPGIPVDLLDALDDPDAARAPSGCGNELADDVGAEVLRAVVVRGPVPSSVPDDGGVLVVTRGSSEDAVWWMPSCSAVAADARARSVVG